MKLQEKINYLQDNHFGEWLKVRQVTQDEVSDRQSMFCVCRRLATGFHESSCRQFQKKVSSETVKKLQDLIPKS